MGQEAETKLKLEMVASINEELEQMHLGHRKGWLKRRVEKRRKINHLAIQKTEQDLNQMHKDSVKLTERILALEEQSLQKLSEMSSTLPTLASFVMEHSNLKGCPWFKEDLFKARPLRATFNSRRS